MEKLYTTTKDLFDYCTEHIGPGMGNRWNDWCESAGQRRRVIPTIERKTQLCSSCRLHASRYKIKGGKDDHGEIQGPV